MGEGRKHFFFEKKKQKTLTYRPHYHRGRPTTRRNGSQEAKVFWFFFSKKNILPFLKTPR